MPVKRVAGFKAEAVPRAESREFKPEGRASGQQGLGPALVLPGAAWVCCWTALLCVVAGQAIALAGDSSCDGA